MMRRLFLLVAVSLALCAQPALAEPAVVLATTTSTQDTGLLDVLVPAFEKSTGYAVKTIAVGTGAALAMGERGDADVLLVHAPSAEEAYMAKNRGLTRALTSADGQRIIGTYGRERFGAFSFVAVLVGIVALATGAASAMQRRWA